MDWSAVYSESGEETGDWEGHWLHTRLQPLVDRVAPGGFSPAIAVCLCCNYVIGVGSLGVPYAVYRGGIVLGLVLILVVTLVSLATSMWVAETVFRAKMLAALPCERGSRRWKCLNAHGHPAPRLGVVSVNVQTREESGAKVKHVFPQLSQQQQQQHQPSGKELISPALAAAAAGPEQAIQRLRAQRLRQQQRARVRTGNPQHDGDELLDEDEGVDVNINDVEMDVEPPAKESTGLLADADAATAQYGALVKTTPQRPRTETLDSADSCRHASIASQGSAGPPSAKADRGRGRLGSHGGAGSEKNFEVTQLCYKFGGASSKYTYQLALMALMYVGLMAYTQIFMVSFVSQSRSSQSVWGSHYVACAIFAAVVVPLSCIDLAEQVYVQVATFVFRIFALLIVIIGSVVAMFYDEADADTNAGSGGPQQHTRDSDASSAPFVSTHIRAVNWQFFGLAFSTALFSQLFQHSVPGLILPLTPRHERAIPRVIIGALTITASLYILLGTFAVLYFGSGTRESVNLNFVHFRWGLHGGEDDAWVIHLVDVLALVAVLFPAVDTVSVFPLVANTLGNNLSVSCPRLRCMLRDVLGLAVRKKHLVVFWRLVAALPPLVGALFVTDLSMSLQVAGLFGLYVAFVAPAMLYRQSYEACRRQFGAATRTPVSTVLSSMWLTVFVLLFAGAALLVCVWQLLQSVLPVTTNGAEGD